MGRNLTSPNIIGNVTQGNSTNANSTVTADTKFNSWYNKSTATSGTTRGLYNRLYIAGAGQSGEAVRVFTTVYDVAASTVHGQQTSLSFNASGSVTGLGAAARNTIPVPNAVSGGTYCATMSEIWGDRSTSSVAGATEFSFHRYVVDGTTADIKATVDTAGYLWSVQGLTVGSGKLFQANTAGAATHALRIKIGSTPYYIMLTSAGA